MSLRRGSGRLFAAAFGVVAFWALNSAPAEPPLAGSRPNLLVIITDDQGHGPIGRHGHPWVQTPNLDELHDRSTRFTRFLVSPTCAPTRAALMTGRHPMRNGVTHTILERERLTLDAVTLPELLRDAGYTTGIFGKWHLGDEDAYQPQNRGFDEVFIHGAGGIGQAYGGSCADAPGNQYTDPVIRHNGVFVQTRGFCTDVFFDATLGWINEARQGEQPFFAYLATNAPHDPFHAPPANIKRLKASGLSDNHAGFYGMVENIDENVGRMMRYLKEWRLLESTVVIFMSDNGMIGIGGGREGERLGADATGRELTGYNSGMRGYKGSVDEGGVRVPLFVRWDGRLEPGRDVDRVTAHIDFLPTLVELAGATPPAAQVEGRSLLPLLADSQADWADRYLFTHRGRWPLGDEPNNHQWTGGFAVRSARFRLVNNNRLHDLLADPGQKRNVFGQHPKVVATMRAAYDTWWKKTRPLMVNEARELASTRPFHDAFREQQETIDIPEWRPAAFLTRGLDDEP